MHSERVVYTVKELDSHAYNRQSKKKTFGHIKLFLCQKSYFWVRTSFGEFFFPLMALHEINEGGTPYMVISPG